MTRIWPIIAVGDVQRSAAWYEHALDASRSGTQSTSFEQILADDFEVLICLHRLEPSAESGEREWDAFRHMASGATPGCGVMLWFVVPDFDAAWARLRDSGTAIVEPPNTNNGTGLRAFIVRDPDGYYVALNESGA